VLTGIALIMTVGVYGVVAGIVKLDDGGLYLLKTVGDSWFGSLQKKIGRAILVAAPYMMKSLTVIGTVAMFMVGGGILTHGWPAAHHMITGLTQGMATVAGIGPVLAVIGPSILDALFGVVAGAAVLVLVSAVQRLVRLLRPAKA